MLTNGFVFILKGFLQTNDGLVLKPVQSPPRGEREHNFFKKIFSSVESELNQDEKELKNLLPTYRGPFMHNNSKSLYFWFSFRLITIFFSIFLIKVMYIKMDDLAYGLKYPAVIDFKIGRQTHDPEASTEKITRQKLKYPPCEKIGFQLLGMRVSYLFTFFLKFLRAIIFFVCCQISLFLAHFYFKT